MFFHHSIDALSADSIFGRQVQVQILPCPAQQGPDASGACALCAAGRFANASVCVACGKGTYSDLAGALNCTRCASNLYQNQPGATSCIACPSGLLPSPDRTACLLSCSAGFGVDSDGGGCQECSAGQYGDGAKW